MRCPVITTRRRETLPLDVGDLSLSKSRLGGGSFTIILQFCSNNDILMINLLTSSHFFISEVGVILSNNRLGMIYDDSIPFIKLSVNKLFIISHYFQMSDDTSTDTLTVRV